jgi:uracil-DNA glycosylase
LLSQLYAPCQNFSLCPLGNVGRKNIIFGSGNPDAKILLIREGPGKNEDEQEVPVLPAYHPAYILRVLKKLSLFSQNLQAAFSLVLAEDSLDKNHLNKTVSL